MRSATSLLLVSVLLGLAACGGPDVGEQTPSELHEACIAVFEEKGGPAELGRQMCDSMRAACEADPSGDECQKAKRIVEKG